MANEKKRILIYLYAYAPFANANTNVMMPIINELKKHYQIDILTRDITNSAPPSEIINDVHVFRHHKKASHGLLYYLTDTSYVGLKKKRKPWKQALVWLLVAAGRFVRIFYQSSEQRLLTKLIADNKYSLVISTCESFLSHYNMLQYKLRHTVCPKWIAYYMDPYAYCALRKDNLEYNASIEAYVYQECDLAIVTPEIYEENKTNKFSPYLYKTIPLPLANLDFSAKHAQSDFIFSDEINCIYCGSLFNITLRDPEYLYRIFTLLDDSIGLTMILYKADQENQELIAKYCQGKKNIHIHYQMPLENSLAVMHKADILINLGNKVSNQTPSKVFDYIATGKPIINLYSLENDTSKRYLKDYPLCLNLHELEEALAENTEAFTAFCKANKGKALEPAALINQYSGYTQETVSGKMLAIVQDLIAGAPLKRTAGTDAAES